MVNSFRAARAGRCKLNVPVIVAMQVLPPIASRFLDGHPGVTLEIAANDTFIDVIGAGFDAGIRYEERMERDMIAVPIGPRVQHYVAAAAPAYLAARGAPGAPARPASTMPASATGSRAACVAEWEFERGGESVRIHAGGAADRDRRTNSNSAAAIAGLGMICTFEEFLSAALDRGAA